MYCFKRVFFSEINKSESLRLHWMDDIFVFASALEFITQLFHDLFKILHVRTYGNRNINVSLYQVIFCLFAVLLIFVHVVRHPFPFWILDDREFIFPAKIVADFTKPMVVFFAAVVLFSVNERHRIQEYMIVDTMRPHMGGDDNFKSVAP